MKFNILEFDNHPLSATTLHPKKQKVELFFHICNHAMVMTFISRIYRAVGPFGEKFDFLAPRNLKLDATLITKPKN